MTVFDKVLGQPQVAGIKGFDFDLNAAFRHQASAFFKHAWRIGHDVVGFGKVHRAAIECTNLWSAINHMLNPIKSWDHVSAVSQGQGGGWRPGDDVTAHARGQVDDDVGVAGADPLNHFAVKLRIAGRGAGFWVANVTVGDCGACFGRLDGGGGDLLGRVRGT